MKIHRVLHKIALFASHISVPTEKFHKSWLVLSIVTLTFPVFLGCSKSEHPQDGDFTEVTHNSSVKPAVQKHQVIKGGYLDALVFNDDHMQRLDCYQQMEWNGQESILIGSCSGDKIVLLCANLNQEKDFWKQYLSFSKAREIEASIENENRNAPIMVGVSHIKAGNNTEISLERLSSEIILRSIKCDFSGKPYEGEPITDAKAFLTNINATCSVLLRDEETIGRVINHKGLLMDDIIAFEDSTLIYSVIGEIGHEVIQPDVKLIAYPNTAREETIGTPFTRLVIEGKIMGETWYWPIDINRGFGSTPPEGIHRNNRYIFDINIRSKGTKDPDTPVKREMLETVFEVAKWEEKEEYSVTF